MYILMFYSLATRKKLLEKLTWISLDETTDIESRVVANVIIDM